MMKPSWTGGAQRIPDPTTSGDFTRRFEEADILNLMEITNTVRQRVWRQQPKGFLSEAFIETDGTIAQTLGECKGGKGSGPDAFVTQVLRMWLAIT